MATFITQSDYDVAIHTEILDAIIRNNPALLEMAEDTAIKQIRGYIGQRYDCDNIFNKTGTNRDPLIMMHVIDIALYHLHAAYNPNRFPEIRKERYKDATEWLKLVQSGNANYEGLPLKTDTDGNTGNASKISITGNTKRNNHF
jgi:phage gp36-like protein